MGLGLAIIVLLSIGVVLGFMVIQAMFAARKWRSVISEGDHGALMEGHAAGRLAGTPHRRADRRRSLPDPRLHPRRTGRARRRRAA